MQLSAEGERCWHAYLDQLPEGAERSIPKVVADYAGDPEITDRLIGLYLAGTKTAGSGLVEDYAGAGDPLPEVGDHWIALGADGRPRCILRTRRVETHRFADVPERIALAEGEGDLSLAYWKRAHADHYAPFLQAWGVADLEQATVVTEFFDVVFRCEPATG